MLDAQQYHIDVQNQITTLSIVHIRRIKSNDTRKSVENFQKYEKGIKSSLDYFHQSDASLWLCLLLTKLLH